MQGNPALNRVRWAHSGKEIAVGDSDGQVLVYDVGEVSKHESAFQFLTVPLKTKTKETIWILQKRVSLSPATMCNLVMRD